MHIHFSGPRPAVLGPDSERSPAFPVPEASSGM